MFTLRRVRHGRMAAALATVLTLAAGSAVAWPTVAAAKLPPPCSHSPQPKATGLDSELTAVGAVSACNAWAVGTESVSALAERTLIEHWNGTSWAVVPSANPVLGPAARRQDQLSGIAVLNAKNAWAVGGVVAVTKTATIVEHWDGHKWKAVVSPRPSGNSELAAVAASSATSVWAVGETTSSQHIRSVIEHYTGKKWYLMKSPNPGAEATVLDSVAASNAKRAWAGGYACHSGGPCLPVIVGWNGKKWSQQPLPALPKAEDGAIDGITAVPGTTTSAWAVGYYESATDAQIALIYHWNGKGWHRVYPALPKNANTWLKGVVAFSGKSALAAGFAQDLKTRLEYNVQVRWNGKKWTLSPATGTPAGPGADYELTGVGGRSCGSAWAVGYSAVGVTGNARPTAFRC
jgi:hypothetical protein